MVYGRTPFQHLRQNFSKLQAIANPVLYQCFQIGVKSDVWSLGCILYQMVYGRTPFQHLRHNFSKLQAIINPDFPIEFPDIPNKHLIDVMRVGYLLYCESVLYFGAPKMFAVINLKLK